MSHDLVKMQRLQPNDLQKSKLFEDQLVQAQTRYMKLVVY